MKVLVDNKFQLIEYYPEQSYLKQIWKSRSGEMWDNEYKDEMIQYIDLVLELRPNLITIDLRKFTFAIIPDLQTWTVENIHVPAANIHVAKTAFVASTDFISQLSVEQTHDENPPEVDEIFEHRLRYFDSLNDAETWLHSIESVRVPMA